MVILCALVLLQLCRYCYGWANPFQGPLEGVGFRNGFTRIKIILFWYWYWYWLPSPRNLEINSDM
jgi:hypothetical protein